MPLYFQDVFGATGEISDSLAISYTGHWEEEMADFVARVGDDGLVGDGGSDRVDDVGHLLNELPDEFPIREISREKF